MASPRPPDPLLPLPELRALYEAGSLSLKVVAGRAGISTARLARLAAREGWERMRAPAHRAGEPLAPRLRRAILAEIAALEALDPSGDGTTNDRLKAHELRHRLLTSLVRMHEKLSEAGGKAAAPRKRAKAEATGDTHDGFDREAVLARLAQRLDRLGDEGAARELPCKPE
ncbi:MAG: hypothetical protein HXY25_04435 [Alphaproteobacteria bacterium]|nr:hypothetical protein [Alphaproteobacteria bacterium]